MPEGGLPGMGPEGGLEMSPRESMDTPAAALHANSMPGHRRTSTGARH